jgi:hypothetical protein
MDCVALIIWETPEAKECEPKPLNWIPAKLAKTVSLEYGG